MLQTDQMTIWKAQICAGNECFERCQTLSALAHYNKAIRQAEYLLDNWIDHKAAVASVVISYHNLADLYLREDKAILAEHELEKVHKKISTCLSEAQPNSYRANALIWGVSQTYIALINHQKNHPEHVMSVPPLIPNLFETTFKNTLN
ncbi:hypothetical protein [Paraglaciecola marina]|uniref:hypothetical protein n=1 Tax=Paraglaciecola marina TaxID=2500157 RepID=UPI00105F3433|nr:hypothetical protein [Paraglaciecola marina]